MFNWKKFVGLKTPDGASDATKNDPKARRIKIIKNTVGGIILLAILIKAGTSANKARENAEEIIGSAAESGASAQEQAQEAALNGRRLFVAITDANLNREAMGRPTVWPHLSEADGLIDDDDEDIAGKVFATSFEYFSALLGLSAESREEYNPYVKVPTEFIKTLVTRVGKNRYLFNWIVLAGVTYELDDCTPVLVSANVDPAHLPVRGGAACRATAQIPAGSAAGRKFLPWGDDYAVVVRKSGDADVIPLSGLTARALCGGGTFTVPDGVTLKYLP